MIRKMLMIILIGGFVFAAGKLFAQSVGSYHHEEAVTDTASKESVNVGNKICPVSSEKIGEQMTAATYEYEGKIYNFCCASCIVKFKKDPQKYIKKAEEELKSQSKDEVGHQGHEEGMMHEGHHH